MTDEKNQGTLWASAKTSELSPPYHPLIRELAAEKNLPEDSMKSLLTHLFSPEAEKDRQFLYENARKTANETFGNKVYLRGLIEFTNYCRNDCYYCGIRAGNKKASRYRLTREEILECCHEGHDLGLHTFVLQGGEDMAYSPQDVADLVSSIKATFPDCAVTLSIGERSHEDYLLWYEAGADRYLLRHETADEAHYRKLHPKNLSLKHRMDCLYDLKSIGYQTGAGFMVGSPGQTIETLLEDLAFLKKLKPEMIGIGPFIPHKDTPFAREAAGSMTQTLVLLSILRLMHPKALLPSTTALSTISENGRELGILAGGNVVMPNLSPGSVRKKYMLYNNKRSDGSEAAQHIDELARRFEAIGYTIDFGRGDAPSHTL